MPLLFISGYANTENFFYSLKNISVKKEAKQFVGVLDKYAFMGQRNTSVLSKDKVSL